MSQKGKHSKFIQKQFLRPNTGSTAAMTVAQRGRILCRIILLKKMSTVSQISENTPVPAQSMTVSLQLCSSLLQDFSIR